MEKYFDKFGQRVKEGDKIRFTLYDGEENKEFIVTKNENIPGGLFPPTMKYIEFTIVQDGKPEKRNKRIVALDLETNSIMTVVDYDYKESKCILRHTCHTFGHIKYHDNRHGYCHQFLNKLIIKSTNT